MSDSTLDPDNIPVGNDRVLGRGHGNRSLGPSDNSDSGSDVAGDPEIGADSDSDSQGTGERADVGMQVLDTGGDIGFDHVEAMPGADAMVDGDFRDVVPLEDDGSVPEEQPAPDQRLDRNQRPQHDDSLDASLRPTSRS